MRKQAYTPELQEKKRAYYLANREKLLEKRKERYQNEAERLKAIQRRYNQNHPLTEEQKLAARKRSTAHYLANRAKVLERAKEYHKQHPEIGRRAAVACNHRRRAAKQKTVTDLKGINAWMHEIRSLPFVRCHWCGTKVKGDEIHFDHVIPLSRNGSHTIGNLCASCPDCNLSKHNRLIADWICQGQTFLSL